MEAEETVVMCENKSKLCVSGLPVGRRVKTMHLWLALHRHFYKGKRTAEWFGTKNIFKTYKKIMVKEIIS